MDYKTDMARVTGLGSARTGTDEWYRGRMLSAALVPLTLLFLWIVAPLIGGDFESVIAAFGNPFNATVTILFVLVAFKHLADGLHEVIVDYVHGKAALTISLVATRLICYFFGAAGAVAVAKIAFIG